MTAVSEAEFRINLLEMFKALDLDQNDWLDWNECRDVVKEIMKPLGGYNPNSFKAKYDAMDKNKDALISKAELIDVVLEMGRDTKLFVPGPPQTRTPSYPKETAAAKAAASSGISENEFRVNVLEMFKALDMDQNDRLDWNECQDVVSSIMKSQGGYNAKTFKEKY